MKDHRQIEELMAVQALGGLDPDDEASLRREMSGHGAGCAECRRLETEFAEVAGRLAFALDPAPVREGLEDETVALARRDRAVPGRAAQHPSKPRRPTLMRPIVAVAASLVLFAAGLGVGSLLADGGDGIPGGARVVAFEGVGAGNLSVAYRPGEDGVYVVGSDLESLPGGSVYEVWMVQDGTPVSATCFRPSSGGSVFEFVDAGLGSTQQMAVTVEAASCPIEPTSTAIFTAQISV